MEKQMTHGKLRVANGFDHLIAAWLARQSIAATFSATGMAMNLASEMQCECTCLQISCRDWVGLALLFALAGCQSTRQPQVVVYAALDREFSGPVLSDFEKANGIRILPKYDEESTKTVGLTSVLIQEAG